MMCKQTKMLDLKNLSLNFFRHHTECALRIVLRAVAVPALNAGIDGIGAVNRTVYMFGRVDVEGQRLAVQLDSVIAETWDQIKGFLGDSAYIKFWRRPGGPEVGMIIWVGGSAKGRKSVLMYADMVGMGICAVFRMGEDDVGAQLADERRQLRNSVSLGHCAHPAIWPIQPVQVANAQRLARTFQFTRADSRQRIRRGAVIAVDGCRFAARCTDQRDVRAVLPIFRQCAPNADFIVRMRKDAEDAKCVDHVGDYTQESRKPRNQETGRTGDQETGRPGDRRDAALL